MRIALLALLATASCATGGGLYQSYVGNVSQSDAVMYANNICEFVGHQDRADSRPVVLESPNGDTVVAPAIKACLERRGIRVAGSGSGHRLKYEIAPMSDGMLLRISLDKGDAAKFFAKSGSGFAAASPFVTRDDRE